MTTMGQKFKKEAEQIWNSPGYGYVRDRLRYLDTIELCHKEIIELDRRIEDLEKNTEIGELIREIETVLSGYDY
jgi:hypothetical protein